MINLPLESDHIRSMTEHDLEMVYSWRNHPEIRRYMYTQHEITLNEHILWFERATKNSSKHLLIYETKIFAQGFIQFTQIGDGPIAEWGFYAAPDSPKGTGTRMGNLALQYAFTRIGMHKICGEAMDFNEPSKRLHHALGFMQEGLLRDQHYDGKQFHDVHCFGLLSSEWTLPTG